MCPNYEPDILPHRKANQQPFDSDLLAFLRDRLGLLPIQMPFKGRLLRLMFLPKNIPGGMKLK